MSSILPDFWQDLMGDSIQRGAVIKGRKGSEKVEDRRHLYQDPFGTVDMRGYGSPEGVHDISTDIAGGAAALVDQAGFGYGDVPLAWLMSQLPNRGTYEEELALAKNLQNQYRDNHPVRNNLLRLAMMAMPGSVPRAALGKVNNMAFNLAAKEEPLSGILMGWPANRLLLGLLGAEAYGGYHHVVANRPRSSKREMKRRTGFDKKGDFK